MSATSVAGGEAVFGGVKEYLSKGYQIVGAVDREPFSGQAGVVMLVLLQSGQDVVFCEVGLSFSSKGYQSGPWNNDSKCKPLLVDDEGQTLSEDGN